jgi:hypothetical protein
VPQRYATGWVRNGEVGRTYHAGGGDNASYYGYGAEVLAAADGVIVEAIDPFPDQEPFARSRNNEAAGNFAVVDIGGGHYAV